MSTQALVASTLRNRARRRALATAACIVVLVPVLAFACLLGVISSEQEAQCGPAGTVELVPGGSAGLQALYATPLALAAGHTYEVGATRYGGPGDPSSGDYGAIPNPAQAYLPGHPDTFAELSVLAHNPANSGGFQFSDANALDQLPYMTALRVSRGPSSLVLYKRDIGYGQGPGETIENGQPYRLDLWWRAAAALGVSKGAVSVSLAPAGGSGAALQMLPEAQMPSAQSATCSAGESLSSVPLPLVAGTRTRILPSGLAAAGEQAPRAVRAMVAAGNRLHGAAYLYGGGHGSSLDVLQGAYDCSSAVSYVLHAGGTLGEYALDSSGLSRYGVPGPGRFVTIYANAAHAFVYVAGLRLDTVEDPAYDSGPNAGVSGPRWRVSQSVPGWAAWTARHPPGL